MKQEYHKSRKDRLFKEYDFFEHFQVSYGIQMLNDYREKHLKDLQSFRKIVMSTTTDLIWIEDLLEQSSDITNIQKIMKNDEKEKNQ